MNQTHVPTSKRGRSMQDASGAKNQGTPRRGHRRQPQQQSPVSPTSVVATRQFEYPRKLSDFSTSTPPPGVDQQERSREYLTTVVFSPTSVAAEQKQSHRRLVSYDDMEELNKKLRDLMVQPIEPYNQDQEQDRPELLSLSDERIEDILRLHMPSYNLDENDGERDDLASSSSAPEPLIPPRPRLVRSEPQARLLPRYDDSGSEVNSEIDGKDDEREDEADQNDALEDDLEKYAKQLCRGGFMGRSSKMNAYSAAHVESNRTGKETRETEPMDDASFHFGKSDLEKLEAFDELLNKEITIIRTFSTEQTAVPKQKPTHRRKKSMVGLWSGRPALDS